MVNYVVQIPPKLASVSKNEKKKNEATLYLHQDTSITSKAGQSAFSGKEKPTCILNLRTQVDKFFANQASY